VIAAVYTDSDKSLLNKRSGNIAIVAEVAKELNVFDIGGLQPPSIRSLRFLIPSLVMAQFSDKTKAQNLKTFLMNTVPDFLLPMELMKGGAPSPSE
jgi:hypothetical protein